MSFHYNDIQKRAIRNVVRDEVAKDPLISSRDLAVRVSARLKHQVSRQYIQSMIKKVDGELLREISQQQELAIDMQRSGELFRVLKSKLMAIACWHPDLAKDDPSLLFMPFYKDQVAALKAIAMIEKLSFDMKLDSGIYKRHLGTLEVEARNKPIPPEVLNLVGNAMKNWGFAPPDRIAVEATQIENANTAPTTEKRALQAAN